MAEVTQTNADGTTITAKQGHSVRWAIVTIVGMDLLLLIMLATVLLRLTPKKWCAVQVSAAQVQGQVAPVQDCTNIILQMLQVYRETALGLLLAIVASHIIIVVMVMGAKVDMSGFFGQFKVGAGAEQ